MSRDNFWSANASLHDIVTDAWNELGHQWAGVASHHSSRCSDDYANVAHPGRWSRPLGAPRIGSEAKAVYKTPPTALSIARPLIARIL
jgi:hypothetical protein